MKVIEDLTKTHLSIGAILGAAALLFAGWNAIRSEIVLASDLQQVEQTWSQAIKANTSALVAMQKMDIKADLREIARELAKLEIAHEEGEWDEDLAMYRAELLEEQLALRAALESLEDSE